MSLPLNKEQVLALVALAIGGAIYASRGPIDPGRSTATRPILQYEQKPVVPAPLVTDDAAPGRRDLFTQPSETRALPPRDLEFPAAPPATVVAPPLDPGPDFRHLGMLAIDGGAVDGVTLQTGGGGAAAGNGGEVEAPTAPEQAPPTSAERRAQAMKVYDQVTLQGQTVPFVGILDVFKVTTTPPTRVDPFEAEKITDFDGYEVRIRVFKVDEGKLENSPRRFLPGQQQKVERVHLADNLKNDLERKRRAVPEDSGHLEERGRFIAELLTKARDEAWVYDLALQQAKLYAQLAGQNDLDGLRWQQRVLAARGDLEGLFALFSNIQGLNRESAFRYQGLGEIEARLGLAEDAERDLQKAVSLAAGDARPPAALAEFLRTRGRSREALAAARQAQRGFGGLATREDKVQVVRTLVACQLAVGAVDDAKAARDLLGNTDAPPYLDGCIAYARGDLPAALTSFRNAGNTADRDDAQFGEAACLLRQGAWQEAHDALHAVYDRAPLLRHRAAAALSLLFQRLGNYDNALSWADRALEAAPQDTYSAYLRGRALRLSGQLQAADEALSAALRNHDDFVHAVVEMARIYAARAEQALGTETAKNAFYALRYSDRAVALAPAARSEWFRLQGLLHFRGADPRGAITAFQKARDTAADDDGKLYARGALAVIDYSLGRQDSALDDLDRLSKELTKDAPVHVWAEARMKEIYEHAQKEMLEDRFERKDPGNIWNSEQDGQLRAAIGGGGLVFDGTFQRKSEVYAERDKAVQKGKNFLAVACRMRLGTGNAAENFCGLRIRTQQGGSGRSETEVSIGIQDGGPFLLAIDGKTDPVRKKCEVAGFDRAGIQDLELRVLPKAPDDARNFVLQVSWNGQVVHSQPLTGLSGGTATELKTQLFAAGSKTARVDVWFDDYRLERRKEQ